MLQEAQATANKMTITSAAVAKCIGKINESLNSDDVLDEAMLYIQLEKMQLLIGMMSKDIRDITSSVSAAIGSMADECDESADL